MKEKLDLLRKNVQRMTLQADKHTLAETSVNDAAYYIC